MDAMKIAVGGDSNAHAGVDTDIPELTASIFLPFKQLLNLSVLAGISKLDYFFSSMKLIDKRFELYDSIEGKLTREHQEILTEMILKSFEVSYDPTETKAKFIVKYPS